MKKATDEQLREALMNQEFWDAAYERLTTKYRLGEEVENMLYNAGLFYKEEIVESLLDGTYEWSVPRKVLIAKHGTSKKRTVYVYEMKDRLVQGVMYRALSHVYADCININCFSYKKGTNAGNAIRYIIDNRENCTYGVKLDIHAYFNSVKKDKVQEMLDELFSGGFHKTMSNIMINDTVLFQGKKVDEFKSLIPGSSLGSFFANYTLRDCDKYFITNNIVYARYSDDMIVLGDSNEKLNEYINVIKGYLNKYGLEINNSKYKWFTPSDSLDFLGLKIMPDDKVDIADHSKMKLKKQIHRWCRKGRIKIEKGETTFVKEAKSIIKRFNQKNFKCFINHEASFGWCHYAYRYITVIDSLRELDFYFKDTLKAMKTGKHNKANVNKISEEEFKELGYVSLVALYKLYKLDFNYYCEVIELF